MEYSVDKSDLQTSLEKKIEELELAVAQYVALCVVCKAPSSCHRHIHILLVSVTVVVAKGCPRMSTTEECSIYRMFLNAMLTL